MLATVDKHQDYEVAIEIELGRLEGSAMGQCSRAVQTLVKRSRASKRSNNTEILIVGLNVVTKGPHP